MEFASGNIYIRPNGPLRKGDGCGDHFHNFDHTTIIFTGSVHVKAKLPDGRVMEQDFHAPGYFLVRKDVKHEIVALEDNTVFWCVYSHRNPQGEIVQVATGWPDGYV